MIRDWTARIMEDNPKIVHRPGKLLVIPDALSRVHYAVYLEGLEKESGDHHLMGSANMILAKEDWFEMEVEPKDYVEMHVNIKD